MAEFVGYSKTPRLYREVIITEKIDGTNACLLIEEDPYGVVVDSDPDRTAVVVEGSRVTYLYAQSRNKFITPDKDNYGFAAWVSENAETLARILGPGRWYGEWWGKGIQRGYGMDFKVFSLFSGEEARLLKRHGGVLDFDMVKAMDQINLRFVPLVKTGVLSDDLVEGSLSKLRSQGSLASYGYSNPEGIIVYHKDAGKVFKVLLENDDISKTEAGIK